jgi:uridine kinase
VTFLPLFERIDGLTSENAIVAIEGGSASGKSTLSEILSDVYDCTVFHMDDFFLRPEQRTPERFAEVGGNIDHERFLCEVLTPLREGKTVNYRRFDCCEMKIQDGVDIQPKSLNIVEGAYSMHPSLDGLYDLSVFLDVDAELQRTRIEKRNSPDMAKRFFDTWIPLEQKYFSATNVKERCDFTIEIK